jgi:phosphatidylserine/phosphatidylglycerophosphate/cardiolipin synthase-like enzyme
LVEEIDAAREKIYVEVYIFTETHLRDALIRAHKRGIEVKILLENNPYKAPYLNDKHYNAFQDAGVNVVWSDPLNYSLNHSKLLLIDEKAYISTGNFSYSLFKYNRDFLVSFTDSEFLESLEKLFLQDFNHQNIGVYHESLVLSPEYSRFKLTSLLQGSQESVKFYFPYIADDDFS